MQANFTQSGLFPQSPPDLVNAIMEALASLGGEHVLIAAQAVSLRMTTVR